VEAAAEAVEKLPLGYPTLSALAPPASQQRKTITFGSPPPTNKGGYTKESYPSTIVIPQPARFRQTPSEQSRPSTTEPVTGEADAVEKLPLGYDTISSTAPPSAPAQPRKVIKFQSTKSGMDTGYTKESFPSTIIVPQPQLGVARFRQQDSSNSGSDGSHHLRSLLYRRRGRAQA